MWSVWWVVFVVLRVVIYVVECVVVCVVWCCGGVYVVGMVHVTHACVPIALTLMLFAPFFRPVDFRFHEWNGTVVGRDVRQSFDQRPPHRCGVSLSDFECSFLFEPVPFHGDGRPGGTHHVVVVQKRFHGLVRRQQMFVGRQKWQKHCFVGCVAGTAQPLAETQPQCPKLGPRSSTFAVQPQQQQQQHQQHQQRQQQRQQQQQPGATFLSPPRSLFHDLVQFPHRHVCGRAAPSASHHF